MVIDLVTGHSEWHCVVGNTRETLMSVTCNGLHFPSSMEIEDQVISSSSDEIVPDTSAPIVEETYRERALCIALILADTVSKDSQVRIVVCIRPSRSLGKEMHIITYTSRIIIASS